MKRRLSILFILIAFSVILSGFQSSGYLNYININHDIPTDNSKVHQEMINKTKLDTSIYKPREINELGLDEMDLSSQEMVRFGKKENLWRLKATYYILEEAPIGSTFPEVYMSKDGNELIVMYKEENGTIIQKDVVSNMLTNTEIDLTSHNMSESHPYKITTKIF